MADTAKNDLVLRLAELIDEHNGLNTVVLDMHQQSSWTDYFIITTMTSQAHMRGVARYVNGFLKENDVVPLHRHKHVSEDGWTLVDCGDFVVHLMSKDIRDFYDLERLWYNAKSIYHSSKSS